MVALRPIKPRDALTTAALVKSTLEQAILTGQFAPGERLIQEDLCRQLDVSRQPIREALRLLQSEGLIAERARGGGYTVRVFSEAEIRENYDLRILLEGRAAAHAAAHVDEEFLGALTSMNVELADAVAVGDQARVLDANRKFHRLVWKQASEPLQQAIIGQLWCSVTTFTPLLLPDRAARAVDEHRRIIEGLRRRDEHAARRAMVQHITGAYRDFEELRLKEQGLPARGDQVRTAGPTSVGGHLRPSWPTSGQSEGGALVHALAGLRVVTFEHAVAAPLCTRHLADMGADVIKVESPGGDFARHYDNLVEGESTHFVWLNGGKRSIALDLRSVRDRQIARQLVFGADVVVSNLGPGVLRRRVVEASELPATSILCEITGYAPDGPYADRKAFDLLVQGELGVTMSTGTPEHPAKPAVSLADLAAGSYALSSVLAALHERDRTGRGAHLTISLSTVVAEWMSPLLLMARNGGGDPIRSGLHHSTIAPYGAYQAGDRHLLNVAVQNEQQWHRLVEQVLADVSLLNDPRFATNERRVANRVALDAAIEKALDALSTDELCRRLEAADVPWGRLNTPTEALVHSDVAAPERWRRVTLPSGRTTQVVRGPLAPPDGVAVPRVGQHTAEILAELGVPEA